MTALFCGCAAVGMILFYRDSTTTRVYRSSDSKKDYYTIDANTLSNCGCTRLYIDNFKNGKKIFSIVYEGGVASKTVYRYDQQMNKSDTIRLITTPYLSYGTIILFDSLDYGIFARIDSLAIQRPKGIVYPIEPPKFASYIPDPYYAR
jgi:hypothetical protein